MSVLGGKKKYYLTLSDAIKSLSFAHVVTFFLYFLKIFKLKVQVLSHCASNKTVELFSPVCHIVSFNPIRLKGVKMLRAHSVSFLVNFVFV